MKQLLLSNMLQRQTVSTNLLMYM